MANLVKMTTKITNNFDRVSRATDRARNRYLFRGGALVRTTARRSIRPGKTESAPGSPPRTRTKKGKRLRNAIIFGVDRRKKDTLVGPSYEIVGDAGAAHEFGGRFRDETFPERQFMGPAVKKSAPKLAKFWQDAMK